DEVAEHHGARREPRVIDVSVQRLVQSEDEPGHGEVSCRNRRLVRAERESIRPIWTPVILAPVAGIQRLRLFMWLSVLRNTAFRLRPAAGSGRLDPRDKPEDDG